MMDRCLEIVSNRPVCRDTWIMGFRSPELASATKPGQFVMIKVRPGIEPLLRRPFSVCGADEEHINILYRVVGKGTEIMTTIQAGVSLPVLGPLGNDFAEPAEGEMPVLVGGGIGVAPLLFLAQSMANRRLEFMMGFRTAGEIIRADDFQGPNTISLATDDGSEGHHGFVTDLLQHFLEKHKKLPLKIFACGPRPMLRKVAETALFHGIPCRVSLEAAMACGFGVCQGCVVKASPGGPHTYRYVCQEGPVFDAEAVDWSKFS